jgi:hypothetical protein
MLVLILHSPNSPGQKLRARGFKPPLLFYVSVQHAAGAAFVAWKIIHHPEQHCQFLHTANSVAATDKPLDLAAEFVWVPVVEQA